MEELRARLAPPPPATNIAMLYEQASPLERVALLEHIRLLLKHETRQDLSNLEGGERDG